MCRSEKVSTVWASLLSSIFSFFTQLRFCVNNRVQRMHCYHHLYNSLLTLWWQACCPAFNVAIQNRYNHFGFEVVRWQLVQAYPGRERVGVGRGSIKDSRVSQEEQVEHRVVLAEVDQCPAEHPATHGQQAEPSCYQNHIAEEWSTAALRHLGETDDRITQLPERLWHQHCPQWGSTPTGATCTKVC